MNDNEMHIAQRYIDEGWTLIRGGAPDFLFIKSENDKLVDCIFVEVKTPNDFLSFEQGVYKRLIEEFLGQKYKLEVVSNESFSNHFTLPQAEPNQTKPIHSKPIQNKIISPSKQTNPNQTIPIYPNPFQTKTKQNDDINEYEY